MRKTYDTLILGCGEAGVFAAYELRRRCPGLRVLVVDQGRDIYHRSCPHRGRQGHLLRRLQGLPHHVRFWRGRGLLGREI